MSRATGERPAAAPAWLIIAVLAVAGTTTSLQQTMIVPVLPAFARDFEVSPAETSWLVTATLLTAAVATPLLGRLADLRGKRPVLLVCIAALAVGSALCATAPTLDVVTVGRAIVGIGVAIVPIGTSVLRDQVEPARVPAGIAYISASFGIGSGVGFPLGGLLATAGSWRTMFVVSVAMSVALFVCVLLVIRRDRPGTRGRFDPVGALLLSVALLALLMGITGAGIGDLPGGPMIAAGVFSLTFAVWVAWELRTRSPLVDLRVAMRWPVALTNGATALFSFAIFVNAIVSPMQVQAPTDMRGGFALDTAGAGLFMVPAAASLLVMAPVSGWLIHRFGGRWGLIAGGLLMAVPFTARTFVNAELWHAVVFATLVSIGTALVFAAAPWMLFRHVPVDQTASAISVNALVRSVGASVSSATSGAVLALASVPLGFATGFDLLFAAAAVACACGAALVVAIRTTRGEGA